MKFEILAPKSSRWNVFVALLGNILTDGLPEGAWRCGNDDRGGSKHRYVEAAMAELGGIDIDGTLAFFWEHGGYCDCEIMFNVDRPDLNVPPGGTWRYIRCSLNYRRPPLLGIFLACPTNASTDRLPGRRHAVSQE
jgi:hypothetical protein